MRSLIIIFINVILFIILRYLSVLVVFLFGVGASAGSEKYYNVILLPVLIFQVILIFILYMKKIWIIKIYEAIFSVLIILILYALGEYGIIPF